MPMPEPQRRYRSDDCAPTIIAKGRGAVAETIIDRARANGIYVHESPELVALLMRVDLDSHIPPQLYMVIAELLVWLYRLEKEEQEYTTYPAPGSPSSTRAT
jgi:flagellar biosynthesis protein